MYQNFLALFAKRPHEVQEHIVSKDVWSWLHENGVMVKPQRSVWKLLAAVPQSELTDLVVSNIPESKSVRSFRTAFPGLAEYLRRFRKDVWEMLRLKNGWFRQSPKWELNAFISHMQAQHPFESGVDFRRFEKKAIAPIL